MLLTKFATAFAFLPTGVETAVLALFSIVVVVLWVRVVKVLVDIVANIIKAVKGWL